MDRQAPAFQILFSPNQGRYVVAARDLKAGESILDTHVCCFGTYEKYRAHFCDWCLWNSENPLQYKCESCSQVYFCSDECRTDSKAVHLWVCSAFKELDKCLTAEESDEELVHQSRFVLRFFAEYMHEVSSGSSCKDVQGILSLVGHEAHQSEFEQWLFAAVSRVALGALRAPGDPSLSNLRLKLGTLLSETQIIQLLCIARCNRFGLFGYGDDMAGTVMSLKASYFNHNCLPTAAASFERRYCKLVTLNAVTKGEELAINYLPMAADPATRRDHLQKEYHFQCRCKLCTLPEGEEHTALEHRKREMMCPECEGLLLPLLEPPSALRCRNCYKLIER